MTERYIPRKIEDTYYKFGLRLSEPPKLNRDSAPPAYIKGFQTTVNEEFGIRPTHFQTPHSSVAYEALLAGMTAAPFQEGDPRLRASVRLNIMLTYHLGLELLLIQLGYSQKEAASRAFDAKNDSEKLGSYRQELEELISSNQG